MTVPARGVALAPLRARYADWLGLDAAELVDAREERPQDVRALQLLLRMEREGPDHVAPSWHRAVELAATACALLCLDPRSQPGGDWFDAVADYCAGHIRKVTRRGRGSQWDAASALPGLSLADGDTEIRAVAPGLVQELDKRIGKLQVGGTDLPVDPPPADGGRSDDPPGAPAAVVLTLWVPTTPPMTVGKQMAQAGHAGMIAAALLAGEQAAPTADSDGSARADALDRWLAAGCPARVTRVDPEGWRELTASIADPEAAWAADRLLAVRDAGFTEIAPGTVTVIGRAPR